MAAPIALDSVTHLKDEHRGMAVLAASHGGAYAGYCAAKLGVGAVILNDAGIGLEQAGIAGLGLLQKLGTPAAAYGHESARIGDGQDSLARGVLTFVNAQAKRLGLRPGQPCAEAMRLLQAASLSPSRAPEPMGEARYTAAERNGVEVIVMDSNSLVTPGNDGHIVISGSHGGLLGGRPETAVKHPVFACVCVDADKGADRAGISRLPAFDARGIAGACVSVYTCRIGEGRSVYESGVISVVNERAAALGGQVGQTCKKFAQTMITARTRDRNNP